MPQLSAQDKLKWLGLKRNSQKESVIEEEIAILRKYHDSYDEYRDEVSSNTFPDDFTEHETYCEDLGPEGEGFNSESSVRFTQKITDNIIDEDDDNDSWDDYKAHVQSSSGWAGYKSAFSQNTSFTSNVQTENGGPAAGVIVHDTSGTTKDGVSVSPGAIEVFGKEVHFSSTGETRTGTGTGTPTPPSGGGTSGGGGAPGGGDGESLFEISNLRTKNGSKVVDKGQSITLQVDIENKSDYSEIASVSLYENGERIEGKVLGSLSGTTGPKLGAGETRTIEFVVTKDKYVCNDYRVNKEGPITLCWKPAGVVAGP